MINSNKGQFPVSNSALVELILKHEKEWKSKYRKIIKGGDSVIQKIQNIRDFSENNISSNELKCSLNICNSIINQCISIIDNVQLTMKLSCDDELLAFKVLEESEQILNKSLLNRAYTNEIKRNWSKFGIYGFVAFKINPITCEIEQCDLRHTFFDAECNMKNKQQGRYCGYKKYVFNGIKKKIRYYYYYKDIDKKIYEIIAENTNDNDQINIDSDYPDLGILSRKQFLIQNEPALYFPIIYAGEEEVINDKIYTNALYPQLLDPQRMINILNKQRLVQGTLSKSRILIMDQNNGTSLNGVNIEQGIANKIEKNQHLNINLMFTSNIAGEASPPMVIPEQQADPNIVALLQTAIEDAYAVVGLSYQKESVRNYDYQSAEALKLKMYAESKILQQLMNKYVDCLQSSLAVVLMEYLFLNKKILQVDKENVLNDLIARERDRFYKKMSIIVQPSDSLLAEKAIQKNLQFRQIFAPGTLAFNYAGYELCKTWQDGSISDAKIQRIARANFDNIQRELMDGSISEEEYDNIITQQQAQQQEQAQQAEAEQAAIQKELVNAQIQIEEIKVQNAKEKNDSDLNIKQLELRNQTIIDTNQLNLKKKELELKERELELKERELVLKYTDNKNNLID
jgi:hypothetical protein